MTEENVINCEDEDLGQLLYALFSQGHEEVEIRHPTEGVKIYTRKDYLLSLKQVHGKRKDGSGTNYMERKRQERQKLNMQIRFRTALLSADVRIVDIDDEQHFGKDTKGHDLGAEGMAFLPIKDYPQGVDLANNELGCFLDETLMKLPIRIASG